MCPYLFHLYHEQQLLTSTEEKEWETQVVILRYGESETDDEAHLGSGSESESEEEEEEETPMPLLKRQKTTPPFQRGMPSGQDKSAPEERPEVEKSVSEEDTDPSDPFSNLIGILCSVRADWEVKKRVLTEIGRLVDAPADSTLPGKVADCITNPAELQKSAAEIHRLQEEVDTLKAELFAFKENETATREMADETQKVAERIKATVGESGTALAKAKLFDEKVLEEKKLSGSRMIRILADFSGQVEAAAAEMRTAADRIEESSRKLVSIGSLKELHLSDLSLPDIYPGPSNPGARKDITPDSKKSRSNAAPAAVERIDLESPEEGQAAPVPGAEGERNRNLSDIFEQMEPATKDPTFGSTA